MIENLIDCLKAFLGMCMIFGVVGLPVVFCLNKFGLLNEKNYHDLKFACQLALIVGCGSAVTVAVIESFIDDFL